LIVLDVLCDAEPENVARGKVVELREAVLHRDPRLVTKDADGVPLFISFVVKAKEGI
jgi:hypothetical protein